MLKWSLENNVKINEKIRKLRLDNNLTQEEFAEIINVSRSTIALYEKGIRKPDINIVNIICSHFNLSINDFYGDIKINKTYKLKIIVLIFMFISLLMSIVVSAHFIKINNVYGYNIYNDELKVKNSSDICIVKINDKICEKNDGIIYSLNNINILKKENRNIKYLFKRINVSKHIDVNPLKVYLVFDNVYKYLENEINGSYDSDAYVNSKHFIIELPNYNESLSHDNQKGESKKIIDYYLNIINKNKDVS